MGKLVELSRSERQMIYDALFYIWLAYNRGKPLSEYVNSKERQLAQKIRYADGSVLETVFKCSEVCSR